MDNSWKNNNLLILLNEKESFGNNKLKENIIYYGSDGNEYLYIGKRPTYKYFITEKPSDLALFGKSKYWGGNSIINGFHTTDFPLNVEIKESKNNIDIFVTNLNSKPRIITHKAKKLINLSQCREAFKNEIKIAKETINNNIRTSKLDSTPHIEYDPKGSNLLTFGSSLAQDNSKNIHCIRFNINKIEFTIDEKIINILDVNAIKDLKAKCDQKYMNDYKYGSSFLLSDMADRYGEAEREAFQSIFNYLKKEKIKLVNDIYYTTILGNSKFTTTQLENMLLK